MYQYICILPLYINNRRIYIYTTYEGTIDIRSLLSMQLHFISTVFRFKPKEKLSNHKRISILMIVNIGALRRGLRSLQKSMPQNLHENVLEISFTTTKSLLKIKTILIAALTDHLYCCSLIMTSILIYLFYWHLFYFYFTIELNTTKTK